MVMKTFLPLSALLLFPVLAENQDQPIRVYNIPSLTSVQRVLAELTAGSEASSSQDNGEESAADMAEEEQTGKVETNSDNPEADAAAVAKDKDDAIEKWGKELTEKLGKNYQENELKHEKLEHANSKKAKKGTVEPSDDRGQVDLDLETETDDRTDASIPLFGKNLHQLLEEWTDKNDRQWEIIQDISEDAVTSAANAGFRAWTNVETCSSFSLRVDDGRIRQTPLATAYDLQLIVNCERLQESDVFQGTFRVGVLWMNTTSSMHVTSCAHIVGNKVQNWYGRMGELLGCETRGERLALQNDAIARGATNPDGELGVLMEDLTKQNLVLLSIGAFVTAIFVYLVALMVRTSLRQERKKDAVSSILASGNPEQNETETQDDRDHDDASGPETENVLEDDRHDKFESGEFV